MARLLRVLLPLAAFVALGTFLALADRTDGRAAATPAGVAGYANPILRREFPDPFVVRRAGTFWAYATGSSTGRNVQVARSRDLVSWRVVGEALPRRPSWATERPGLVWAPEVLRRRDGRYLLYFAAPSAAARTQCIGVALGRRPQGPFVPVGSAPLVCQPELGGSIDASPYRHAGGALYLVWKNDGNCCGYKTWIWGQRLTASGTRLTGQRAQLLTGEQPWDRQLVEAPLLHRRGDALVLFYSGAWVENYAVGYARCAGPLGPCTAARENPILRSGCAAVGTGHPALVIDDAKRTWMLYHASLAGGSPRGRLLWLDRVTWTDGASPAVVGPTCERRARPVVRTR